MPGNKRPVKHRLLNYGKYFIKEIIPVTVGILIALSIGNWNQNKKEQKYVDEVFSLIDSELEETLQGIDEILPIQESLIDTLQYYSNNQDISILQTVLKVGGIDVARIKTTAWNGMSSSKIELVDYNKMTSLSNIVEQKGMLDSKSSVMVNFVYENLNETDKNKKEILVLNMRDIMGTEKAIKEIILDYQKQQKGPNS